jgi:hypothetical protein
MSYNIKDPEAERLLHVLAEACRQSKAEVLREVLNQAVAKESLQIPLIERLAPLQARLAAARAAGIDWDELKRANDEAWGE